MGCSLDDKNNVDIKEEFQDEDYIYMDYKDISRLEEKDFYKKISLYGNVIEIEQETLKGNFDEGYYETILWINMLDEDKIYKSVRVKYLRSVTETKILEGDYIDIKGTYMGEYYENMSFDSTNGELRGTAYPEIYADKIEIWETSL